jgi:PAS domain S-box-containing protein
LETDYTIKFDVYYENLPISILIFDDKFDCIYQNTTFKNLTKNAKSTPKSLFDIFNKSDIEKIISEFKLNKKINRAFDSLHANINDNIFLDIKGSFSSLNINKKKYLICSFEKSHYENYIDRIKDSFFKENFIFHTIINLTGPIIFIYKDSRFQLVNEEMVKLTGYSKRELLNMSYWDLLHPTQKEKIKSINVTDIYKDNTPRRYEIKIIKKDGNLAWIDFIACRIPWKKSHAVLGTAFDITKRKEIEEKSLENQQTFQRLFQYHSVKQLIVDPETLNVIDANSAACEFYGYYPDEFKKVNYRNISLTREETLQKNINDILKNKLNFFITKHKNADGFVVDVEIYTSVIKIKGKKIIHGMIFDITTKMRMQKLNTILSRSVEQSPVSVVITDNYGSIVYVNPIFNKVTGYASDEVLGKNPCILKSGKHDNDFYKNLWDTIVSGRVWQGQIINKKKTGEEFIEEAKIAPVFDLNGEISHYVGVKLDITKKLELENEYHQMKKTETIGRLVGGIAHDFNNMLTIIQNNTEIALKYADKKSHVYNSLKEIKDTAMKSSSLVAQLLTYARKQQVNKIIIDINDFIENNIKIIKKLIKENVKIIWKPCKNIWKIKIDSLQLHQIIMNLCLNSADAINCHGEITINAKNLTVDEEHSKKFQFKQKEYVVLEIADNGNGIEEENLKYIFEPYYTTKDKNKGTGLGLATVAGIIEQNNCFIDVQSKVGEGTTFTIYFPRTNEINRPKDETKIKDNIFCYGNGETILITEDEDAILKTTKYILEEFNYKVYTANSPLKALEIVENNDTDIQLLITDVVMPYMNGKELAEKISRKISNIKVIYVSGYPENIIANNGILFEKINFIQKPFTTKKLLSTIKQVLEN